MEGQEDICASMVFAACVSGNKHYREIFLELERAVGNMSNYPVGDFLIRLKNTVLSGKREMSVKATKYIRGVADVLVDLGYLDKVEMKGDNLKITLRVRNKKPLLSEIKLVSKPGLRIYKKTDNLPKVYGGLGIAIISTSKGLMTDTQAREKKLGGEVICCVW